jgi:hypothetical protein
MKRIAVLFAVVALISHTVNAESDTTSVPVPDQSATQVQGIAIPGYGGFDVTAADENTRRYTRLVQRQLPDGSFETATNSFVMLACGLNRLDESRRWVAAEPSFEVIKGASFQ